MIVRLPHRNGVLALFAGLFLATECGAEPPTVEEVLAIYRANVEKLNPLHVQMTYAHEWTQAYREQKRKDIDAKEQVIKALTSGSDELKLDPPVPYTNEQLLQMIRAGLETDQMLVDNTRSARRFEAFVNGNDYQVRTPLSGVVTSPDDWTFPDAPLSTASLLTDYSHVRIYSRSAMMTPPARIWPGQPRPDSRTHAMLTAKHLPETHNFHLPPFMHPMQARWPDQHPVDAFFSQPADSYRIAGEEEQDDGMLTIVEVAVLARGKSTAINDDGTQSIVANMDFCRAWLDLARGALPAKMHVWSRTERGSFDALRAYHPGWIITTAEVTEITDGGFYPSRTVSDEYRIDPNLPQLTAEQWAEYREGKRKVPFVVHEREIWDCHVVDQRVPDDEDFFVLSFPEGQTFYDLDTEKVIGALENKPAVTAGQPAPALTIARWLDGKDHTLEEFRGRVVVLDFWGLWCSACRNAVPALKQLQQKYKDHPITFLSIHTAEADSDALVQRIQAYANEQQWEFLAAIDAGTMIENSVTCHEYGIQGYPTKIIIGSDGIVEYNSTEIPEGFPEELRHLIGRACDEISPEDEAKFEHYEKEHYEAAGETWPVSEKLTPEEVNEVSTRVSVFYLSKRIDAALEKNASK